MALSIKNDRTACVHLRVGYLVETKSQKILKVFGQLGVIDHVMDQLFLTGQGAMVWDVGHGVLVARCARARHLIAGRAHKDILSTLLCCHCSSTIRLAYFVFESMKGIVSDWA